MARADEAPLCLREGRFARFEAIPWWDQSRLARSRVLVVGAGALGNEVIKNLALLGVGSLAVADMDRIEESNLTRSVLFRASDEGQPKAVAAARAARELYPKTNAIPLVGNVLADLGLGWFRWAEAVVGALDNREARLFVNQACARTGRPWIDGGIEVLGGVVRGFAPPRTACYECTMGQADWDQVAKRRSCSLLARAAQAGGGVPTTPTTASVIGGMQAQEVVKILHGMEFLAGRGFVFEGLAHSSYPVEYPVSPDCPWHEEPPRIESVEEFSLATPMRAIRDWAAAKLGGLDAMDLSRELVEKIECPRCSRSRRMMRSVERVREDEARCDGCGAEMVPRFFHSLASDSEMLDLKAGDLGIPAWDILWARYGEQALGIELSGDREEALKGRTA